jgi:hypothetical protein
LILEKSELFVQSSTEGRPYKNQPGFHGMNDQKAAEVQRHVEDFLCSANAHGLDIGKGEHFEKVVGYVREQVDGTDPIEENELRIVTAMCWLGPPAPAGIPPQSQREELQQIIRGLIAKPDQQTLRIMEFVLAYGCGKWRSVEAGEGEWKQRWPGAIQGLQRAMEPAVKEAERWLRGRVVGYQDRSNVDLHGDAWLLALGLIHTQKPLHILNEGLSLECTNDGTELGAARYRNSVPSGAKTVFTVEERHANLELPGGEALNLGIGGKTIISARDDETRINITANGVTTRARLLPWSRGFIKGPATLAFWTCTCGHTHCVERHRLQSWNPAKVTLWSFSASAIKGPQPSIQIGSFIAGMYFPLFASGRLLTRLRRADVEYQVCRSCSTMAAVAAKSNGSEIRDTTQLKLKEFEGDVCQNCRRPFDSTQSNRITHERLIFVGGYVPHYEPRLYIRCKNRSGHYQTMVGQATQEDLAERWDNLYDPLTSTCCPLCAEKPLKARPSVVWTRMFPVVKSLDGDEKSDWTSEQVDDEEAV